MDIGLGPLVDETDGFTAETGLTVAQADVRLKKNAGSWAQKNESSAAAHEENGWHEVNLDSTDTDTLGILLVAVHVAGARPVHREFTVVTANVYDSIVAGSDTLEVELSTQGKADVNAEVVDVLRTDTTGEPAQGSPSVTLSLQEKVDYLYKAWRNKITQSSTEYKLFADDESTVDHKATCSDSGSVATKGEITSGP